MVKNIWTIYFGLVGDGDSGENIQHTVADGYSGGRIYSLLWLIIIVREDTQPTVMDGYSGRRIHSLL